jgi:tetratricopeptide (TPR) repeat protein
MSEDSEAHREKNEGSQAWSRGEYQSAIDHFSKAITLGGSKEFLKVLYSNRSAAYLKLNRVDLALNDGNKCVELDSAWAKGYTRKGDALYSQKKYTEAYNAYNSGLRAAPNDATLTQKAEQAMRAIRAEADRQQQWSSSSSGGGFGSSNTSTPPSTAASGGILRYLELSIFVFAVLYMIPLGRFINVWAYK